MLELNEYNESGALLSVYVESDGRMHQIKQRDILDKAIFQVSNIVEKPFYHVADLMQKPRGRLGLVQSWLKIFLPAGYPYTVTEDYLPYAFLLPLFTRQQNLTQQTDTRSM
jgi:hypothetical protein